MNDEQETNPQLIAELEPLRGRCEHSGGDEREERARFRQLLESIDDAVWAASPDGSKFLFCNKALERVYGRTLEEFKENPGLWAEVVHEDDVEVAQASARELLELGSSEVEYRIIRPDGAVRWINDRKSVVCAANGRPVQIGGFARDVTERKRAEELNRILRDLGLALGASRGMQEGLALCLGAAIQASGMDCGGIYLLDEDSGGFDLVHHQGLSEAFVSVASHCDGNSHHAKLIRAARPVYAEYTKIELPLGQKERDERLRGLAVIPIIYQDAVIACLNVASRSVDRVPEASRVALEAVAAQVGSTIARLRAGEELERHWQDLEALVEERSAAIKASEALFRNLAESALVGIFLFQDMKFIYANPAVSDIFGYGNQELIGQLGPFDLTDPADHGRAREYIDTIFSGRTDLEPFSFLGLRKDGSRIHCEVLGRTIEHRGKPTLLGTLMNVTARINAETRLRESEERYRSTLMRLQEAFYSATLDGTLLDHNAEFNRILGFEESEDLKGSKLPDFWQDPRDRVAYVEKLKSDGTVREWLAKGKRRGGERFTAEISARLLRDDAGTPVRIEGTFLDVTAMREAEKSLKETLTALERSNDDLEKFAYVASHDLQEPLRMVASYLQLFERRYKGRLDQDADEFIGFAVEGAARMKAMIEDLLAYSRVQTRRADLKRTDAGAALKAAIGNLQLAIQESSAEVTCDALPVVRGDEPQLVQLFQNLIENALKFHGCDPPRIHVGAEVRSGDVIFSVSDNGSGIDPKYFKRIFVIFRRLNPDRNKRGTGIGLAVCKRIVERHGGRIWVDSEPGRGSTFYFTIPGGVRSSA